MQIFREKVDGETYWGPDVIRDMSPRTKQERHVKYLCFFLCEKGGYKDTLEYFCQSAEAVVAHACAFVTRGHGRRFKSRMFVPTWRIKYKTRPL